MDRYNNDMSELDSLFATHEQITYESTAPEFTSKSIIVSLNELYPFPGHPFLVREDEDMTALIESIRRNGVLHRILIRPRNSGGYEIISGHRRTEACRMLGIENIPADVRHDFDEDSAIYAMLDTNLKQRKKLLPSERAKAYKMMHDTLMRNGVITSKDGSKKHTRDAISEHFGAHPRQVSRFIRLTNLNSPLLNMVDEGKLQMGAAVQISFLDEETQSWITEHYEDTGELPTVAQVREMRQLLGEGILTSDAFEELMLQEVSKQRAEVTFFERARTELFPDLPLPDIMDQVWMYMENLSQQRRNGLR